jgi:oligopeptidase A
VFVVFHKDSTAGVRSLLLLLLFLWHMFSGRCLSSKYLKIVVAWFLLFTMSILYRAMSLRVGAGLLSASMFSNAHNRRAACDSVRKVSSIAITNPLLNKNSLPLFKEITAVDILPAIQHDLSQLKTDFSNLECSLSGKATDKVEFNYPNVVESMEKMQAPLSYSWGVVGHLMGVQNSDDLRKAHDEIQPAVIEINQQIGQSQVMFRALSALRDTQVQWDGLDECQRRIVSSSIRGMEASGVGLEPVQREQFNKLQLELAELSTKFSNNVLDSTKLFKLKVTDKEQIAGLPESARALAAQQAVGAGDTTATAENGPWLITMDMPSYLPAMQHLKSRALRETLYRAFVTRASSEAHDNAPIIKRILQIKTEMAHMLGYKSFAEKSLSTKMAPSVSAVMDLTAMLREKSLPAAQRDLAELKAFAKTQGFDEEIALWDIPFWSERLREKQYQFQEEELRVYFALPSVLDGMFGLAKRLFGVTIEAADGETQVWNQDVRFFNIKDDSTGEHIASFYLDAYSRPAEKRGGAWMDVCVGKSKVLQRIPVAYLTCNGSPPVGEQPSLMTFREVETLFHEFGHGLQHMLTRVEHGDAAGSEWSDFFDVIFIYYFSCSQQHRMGCS